jgi:hypothetical protein
MLDERRLDPVLRHEFGKFAAVDHMREDVGAGKQLTEGLKHLLAAAHIEEPIMDKGDLESTEIDGRWQLVPRGRVSVVEFNQSRPPKIAPIQGKSGPPAGNGPISSDILQHPALASAIVSPVSSPIKRFGPEPVPAAAEAISCSPHEHQNASLLSSICMRRQTAEIGQIFHIHRS